MVAGKKIHCAVCDKKCSGNVLRYANQYYHKQCFELGDGKRQEESYVDSPSASNIIDPRYHVDDSHTIQSPTHNNNSDDYYNHKQQQQQRQQHSDNTLTSATSAKSLTTTTGGSQQVRAGNTNGLGGTMSPSTATSSHLHHSHQQRSQTIDARGPSTGLLAASSGGSGGQQQQHRSATLPHSISSPANGFLASSRQSFTSCAGCGEKIKDGQALIALDLHWHVWCFKCTHCQTPLHGEYVAKDGRAYCERDYQKLFGVTCVYCKRYITGKVLQAGEAHHFHPSCARCSKCGDPFVPGEEMYLQGEVTWHPRCGPGPDSVVPLDDEIDASSRSQQLRAPRGQSPSLSSRSRSASPFSFMSRQYGRSSPGYADSEAVGDLSRIYTISYLNADPTQGYLRRPIEPNPPKSPQFSRPASSVHGGGGGDRSRSSSRSAHYRERSVPRGMYSVLSSMRSGSSHRARSPSMMNEEAIQLAQYPSGQKPSPNTVPKIERDDFPAPPFPYPRPSNQQTATGGGGDGTGADGEPVATETRHEGQQQQQQRASRPRSREIVIEDEDSTSADNGGGNGGDTRLRKEEEELSKIASGIGKIFLQTLKEREKLRAWKRANLDPRNASRTPSATRELPSRPLRYDNPTGASPSRDMDRPRPWDEDDGGAEHSPTRTRSSLGRPSQMSSSSYGYKVIQSNRSTPKPGYGLSGSGGVVNGNGNGANYELGGGGGGGGELSFSQQQRLAQNRSSELLGRAIQLDPATNGSGGKTRSLVSSSAHLRRSMPNVNLQHHHHHQHHVHIEGPPKLYPYHLLATSNYRLPPDVDRCHLERHLSNEEFQYIFHCDRLDFYHLPEWRRNELKRRAKLF